MSPTFFVAMGRVEVNDDSANERLAASNVALGVAWILLLLTHSPLLLLWTIPPLFLVELKLDRRENLRLWGVCSLDFRLELRIPVAGEGRPDFRLGVENVILFAFILLIDYGITIID